MDKSDTITISANEPSTINFDDLMIEPLDLSSISSLSSAVVNSGNFYSNPLTTNYPSINITTSPSTSGPINYGASGAGQYNWSNISPSLNVKGDAEFEGDIKWKGRSLGNMLEAIEKRLAILSPDPEKLEHFEALQKAYEHYKMLEKLCELPTKDNDT